MSKKLNWAQVDKRIRNRRVSWSKDDGEALERDLMALPDVSNKAEVIAIPQPASLPPEVEEVVAEGGEEAAEAGAEATAS